MAWFGTQFAAGAYRAESSVEKMEVLSFSLLIGKRDMGKAFHGPVD